MDKIIKANPLNDFRIDILTSSGISGIFDVKPYLRGSAFKELADESYFRLVRPAHHGIMWPHEQDFSSDTIVWDIQNAQQPKENYPNIFQEIKASNSTLHSRNHPSTTIPQQTERTPKRIIIKSRSEVKGVRTNSGAQLNSEWNVGARHALYHKDGHWYMPLEHFPGAYFDPDGYVLFKTEKEYQTNAYLKIGKRVDVPGGISRLPGYKKMK